MVRYISLPNETNLAEAKDWIRQQQKVEPYEDPFDCAVGCAYDLGIFEYDAVLIDPGADRDIPQWIVKLCQSFFNREWS